jgi:IPT/TIG domain
MAHFAKPWFRKGRGWLLEINGKRVKRGDERDESFTRYHQIMAGQAPSMYVDAPTITSLSPTSGSTVGGTTVTIVGTNFSTTSSVTIGGVVAAFGVINSTTIAVITPPGLLGGADVVVTSAGGSATAVDTFTYIP